VKKKCSLVGSVVGVVEERSHALNVHVVLSGQVEVLVGGEHALVGSGSSDEGRGHLGPSGRSEVPAKASQEIGSSQQQARRTDRFERLRKAYQ
jgi:hypothetical protein